MNAPPTDGSRWRVVRDDLTPEERAVFDAMVEVQRERDARARTKGRGAAAVQPAGRRRLASRGGD
jgi:hypothetical protein